eukprot:g7179.t1
MKPGSRIWVSLHDGRRYPASPVWCSLAPVDVALLALEGAGAGARAVEYSYTPDGPFDFGTSPARAKRGVGGAAGGGGGGGAGGTGGAGGALRAPFDRIALGDPNAPPLVGSPVFALGYALFSPSSALAPTMCRGEVSKVAAARGRPALLQSTAAVFRGHSGGMLLDRGGRLAALITSNARHASGNIIPQLNFNVPLAELWPLVMHARGRAPLSASAHLGAADARLERLWALEAEMEDVGEVQPPPQQRQSTPGSRWTAAATAAGAIAGFAPPDEHGSASGRRGSQVRTLDSVQSGSGRALRKGKFLVDGKHLKDFVYVPDGFMDNVEDGMDQILDALGISQPEITFAFDDTRGVAPPLPLEAESAWQAQYESRAMAANAQLGPGHANFRSEADLTAHFAEVREHGRHNPPVDHEQTRLTEDRVRTTLEGISEACAQTSAVYLMRRNFRGNRLVELACTSLKPGVAALGLSSNSDFSVVEGDEHGGARREGIDTAVFDTATVALQDSVEHVVCISSEPTAAEHAEYHCRREIVITGGMTHRFTHNLVFHQDAQRCAFADHFMSTFPCGVIAGGGDRALWDMAAHAMRNGLPLFALQGTGGATPALCDLIELGGSVKTLPLLDAQQAGSTSSSDSFDAFLKRPALTKTGEGYASEWVLQQARIFAKNFPEGYNRFATLVISVDNDSGDNGEGDDPFKRQSIDELQDSITLVMAAVYLNSTREMGGQAAEAKSLRRAEKLSGLLRAASDRYRRLSLVLAVVTRVLMLITVSIAVGSANAKHEQSVSDEYQQRLQYANVIAPLGIGMMTSLYSTFRPLAKFAALFAAHKRLAGEIWRFRTRTGDYSGRGEALGVVATTGPRHKFLTKVREIWSQCAGSDASGAYIFHPSSGSMWAPGTAGTAAGGTAVPGSADSERHAGGS